MLTKTRRWVDALFELTALRLTVWFTLVVTTYPGLLLHPHKLANWFDDHLLYAFDEIDRMTVLQYGQLPAWNPYWCGGSAGIAEPEDSFYSPDFLLRLVFGSEHGRRLALVLFFVMAFEGMYRLCRRLDSTAVASALAAIGYATCDRFVSFIHDGWVHFMSFGLCSWVLLALLNGITSVAWRLGGAFILAWLILAPGTYPAPYTAVAFGYVFLVLCVYRFFKREPEPFKGPLLSALTIGGVAILLCACKLVPTTLYMREFTRQFSPVETHTPQEVFGPLVTRYGGLLLLALAGVVVGDLVAGLAIGGALLFFMLSLGETGPWSAFHLMKKVPLLSQLRSPDRFSVMVLLFTALAASRGLTRLEDALPKFVDTASSWASKLPLRSWVKRVTGRDLPALEPREHLALPRELTWLAVAVAAFVSFKIASPIAEELMAAQRAPSMGLFVEEAPRTLVQEFKQSRGNRRDAHSFVHVNMGSLNCVLGIPVPESARLRGDLPQEEYPADPAVAQVKRLKWTPNAIVLDVDAKAATRVFVNQNWARQWRTNVGSVRNDEGLLAVDVPAGHHTLKLEYRDNVIYISLLVSLATLLTLLWFGGRHLVRGARREWTKFGSLPVWPPSVESSGELSGEESDAKIEAPTWRKKFDAFVPLFDFTRIPDTKAGWFVRIGVTALAIVALGRRVNADVGPMLAAHPPQPLPSVEVDDYKFRLPERTRREIFTELATAELAERQRAIAANTWKGHLWSREDDRGWQERVAARAAAAKYRISLTQVFLVLDEGIRNKWPAPDGKPLSATTPPFNPRTDAW